MSSCRRSALFALAVACLSQQALVAQAPGDTYFSLAVTDDSHNHAGVARLFLDFQQAPFSAPDASVGQVVSVESAPGSITLDGDGAEWDPTYLSTVTGLVQNSYPLGEFIDAVPATITVGSAWDATHVYFLVRWEDAGHAASTRYRKWIFGDQGGGESGWNPQVHVGATTGAPNRAAVNATGQVLLGAEDEDRVFLMFPITDVEANFTPTGPGCALYCHANLGDDDPNQEYTGLGVSAMYTNLAGDEADIWHWKSSRTEPSGVADDGWIESSSGTTSGRRADAGSAAYSGNDLSGMDPTWMHPTGLGYEGDVLLGSEAVPFSGSPAPGDQIPRNLSVQPAGSRADVEAAGSYDPVLRTWTVEFRRLRDTGNPDDHSFEGPAAAAPTAALVTSVDPVVGEMLYDLACMNCHGAQGVGNAGPNGWIVPIVQRTSGSTIIAAIENVGPMGGLAGAFSDQELEDMAAYLQTQAPSGPVRTLTVQVQGPVGAASVASVPAGIECPGVCSATFANGLAVTLQAAPVAGLVFTGWSGPCSGTGDCMFTITADTTATASYSPDCNGNGVPDDTDISSGTSGDANGNGVPDECELGSRSPSSSGPPRRFTVTLPGGGSLRVVVESGPGGRSIPLVLPHHDRASIVSRSSLRSE